MQAPPGGGMTGRNFSVAGPQAAIQIFRRKVALGSCAQERHNLRQKRLHFTSLCDRVYVVGFALPIPCFIHGSQ
jgi:hypothetical protein